MTNEQLIQGLSDIVALAVKYSAQNSNVNEVNQLVKNIFVIQQAIELKLKDGD
jgi:hypothetical protein